MAIENLRSAFVYCTQGEAMRIVMPMGLEIDGVPELGLEADHVAE